MTRIMGDATHDNVPALYAQRSGLALVAAYVTGSADIVWTAADRAMFTGIPVVTIDQGFTGSPVASADVRDVEAGAWTPGNAVNRAGWTAPRPTIYCSASVLPALAQAGWRGDVWVASWTGTPSNTPPAVPAGMTCVAVQYTDKGGGGAYDLSVVFDPTWPGSAPVPVPPASWQEDMMRQLPTLRQGATGPDVRSIQALCSARGHTVAVDGVFGPLTTQAVRAEQTGAHVSVDGVVGAQTWPALLGV